MNYLRPDRLDALARAYALKTLSPGAERRFARVVASSLVAAQAVAEWQELLDALEEGAPESPAPRPRVWQGLQQRLFARQPAAASASAGARSGAGTRALVGWASGLGLALGALLCALLLLLQPQWAHLERSTGQAPASYVGVLTDAQGHASVTTIARRYSRLLTVRLLHPVALPAGQVLAVWGWSDAEPTPRLLGRSPNVQSAEVTLAAPAEIVLSKMTHLGITAADAGSVAPLVPVGPFIAVGPCGKVW